MKSPTLLTAAALAGILGIVAASDGEASDGDTIMTATATGSFDVTVEPLHDEKLADGNSLGRYSLVKQYHGELEAAGKGEMLTAGTPVEGAAAYVAIEHVDGTLGGRRGTFVLQHKGTMGHGEQHLEITVVPESATGDLAGLEGALEITIAKDGKHFYELEYTLTEGPRE